MKILSFDDTDISIMDIEHLYRHKKSQTIAHNACHGYYVTSAYTGYRWKGDYIKQYFETLVYRYHTDPISLKRVIVGPIMTYDYRTHDQCITHHNGIISDIWAEYLMQEGK